MLPAPPTTSPTDRRYDPILGTGRSLALRYRWRVGTASTGDDGPDGDRGATRLNLLGPFELVRDREWVDLAPAGQRVVALLALQGRHAHRLRLARTLWPEQSEARALSNLRSTVWRLPGAVRDLLVRRGNMLTLSALVRVDLDAAHVVAKSLCTDDPGLALPPADRDLLTRDLLPGDDEPWLVVPREQHRQRRLHALENLALRDLRDGRPLDAVDTALVALSADELRESAQFLLVRAHLEAGNRAAAVQHFERFRDRLSHEMGITPSGRLVSLVAEVCAATDGRRVGDAAATAGAPWQ